MRPETALEYWSAACEPTGISWWLFKETLLCVNGYHALPEMLPCAQIAVWAQDLPDLVDRVFPRLPQEWLLSKDRFVGSKRELFFSLDNGPVLEIHVLCAVEDEKHLAAVNCARNDLLVKTGRKIKALRTVSKIFRKLFRRLYTGTVGRLVDRSIGKTVDKAFSALLELMGGAGGHLPYCTDCFTNKKAALFSRDLFTDTVLLDCRSPDRADGTVTHENLCYPAFCGYKQYLEEMYGDFENGLFDDIGVGLTTEEKAELRLHQQKCFQALTFLEGLSKEYGLRYYLLAGSVLGAVRHGGFIPWDDDIDVGIRIEDLENFEKLVKEHLPAGLPQGFTLKQSGPNEPYPRMFSKICFEGRCCIDLWPLVPTYSEGLRAKFLWYFGKLITKFHYQKIGYKVTRFKKFVKIVSIFLSDKLVMAMARSNERRYTRRNTPAYINLYSVYRRGKETIGRNWLDTKATAVFNGLEVPVVGHTTEYLTHLYGDYMRFPQPWKRASRHVERF